MGVRDEWKPAESNRPQPVMLDDKAGGGEEKLRWSTGYFDRSTFEGC